MEKSPEAFRTISEAAESVGVPTHVLRFWESRFPQISPVKRAGGRRYYRPADVELLSEIRKLLHDDGMTIRGVRKLLREAGGKAKILQAGPQTSAAVPVLIDDVEEAEAVQDEINTLEDAMSAALPDDDEAPMAVDVEQEDVAPRVLNFSRAAPALITEEPEEDDVPEPVADMIEPAPTLAESPGFEAEPDTAPEPVVFPETGKRRRIRVKRDADWSKVAELVARLEAVSTRAGHKS
ncbi:MAG: MerR family transcriptional regulator [Deltaproteobacteria bacterium]